jgi:glutamyl-tRNA reductase
MIENYHCLSIIVDKKYEQKLSYYSIYDEKFFKDIQKYNINDVVVLQKCNAVEIYHYGTLENLYYLCNMRKQHSLSPTLFRKKDITTFHGKECIKHLFMTAS